VLNGCCAAYGDVAASYFDEKTAQRELANYRNKDPGATTRLLRDLLLKTGRLEGALLDVGSGIGGLTFELLAHDGSGTYSGASLFGEGLRDFHRNPKRVCVGDVRHDGHDNPVLGNGHEGRHHPT
jgi:hypothetical protein